MLVSCQEEDCETTGPEHLPDMPALLPDHKKSPLVGVTPLPVLSLKHLQKSCDIQLSWVALVSSLLGPLASTSEKSLLSISKQQMNPQCSATENRFYFIAGGAKSKENYWYFRDKKNPWELWKQVTKERQNQPKLWAILWLYSPGPTQDSDAASTLLSIFHFNTHTQKPNPTQNKTKQTKAKQSIKPARLHIFLNHSLNSRHCCWKC